MGLLDLFRKKDKKPSESSQAKPSPVNTTEKPITTHSPDSIAPKAPSAQVVAGESITPVCKHPAIQSDSGTSFIFPVLLAVPMPF